MAFLNADFQEGRLYELARGVVVVTNVPGISHGRVVNRVGDLFALYNRDHPGRITYRAGGAECRLILPTLRSDRHPDQAVYLTPPPEVEDQRLWMQWVPAIVVEVVSKGGRRRDLIEKREEYLRLGVLEYWILDPQNRRLLALRRLGDAWEETIVPAGKTYRIHLLPGLVVDPAASLGLS